MKILSAALLCFVLLSHPARADGKEDTIKGMEEYLDFVDYGGATIFPEQIPKDEWKKFYIIDARDQDQFAKEHIPGAVNIEWRQVLSKRDNIPKNKPVIIYCNTGSLSAQGGLHCVLPVMTTSVFCKVAMPSGKPRVGLMPPLKRHHGLNTDPIWG
jgi:hypothetical protein